MIQIPEEDQAVGMRAYASKGEPCHAQVRLTDEDFGVEEMLSTEIVESQRPGYFPVYRVEKHSIDTMHMVNEIEELLRSKVTFAGLKDKRAVAVQYITPTRRNTDMPKAFEHRSFSARLIGYSEEPITKGSMKGNKFSLVLRDACSGVGGRIEEVFSLATAGLIPNYYGHQRFGRSEGGTHLIGRALVKRDFALAIRLMLFEPRKDDDGATRQGREAMASGDYATGLRLLHPSQDIERAVASRLAVKPYDPVGALRAVNVRLRRLFVQAYQSYIFNATLSLALARGVSISAYCPGDNWCEWEEQGLGRSKVRGVRDPPTKSAVPMVQLVGYAFRDYGSRFDSLTKEAMTTEGIAAKDFYIKEMEESSAEGGFRVPHQVVRNSHFEINEESASIGFMLARGQYATVLLREIIKPDSPRESGMG